MKYVVKQYNSFWTSWFFCVDTIDYHSWSTLCFLSVLIGHIQKEKKKEAHIFQILQACKVFHTNSNPQSLTSHTIRDGKYENWDAGLNVKILL